MAFTPFASVREAGRCLWRLVCRWLSIPIQFPGKIALVLAAGAMAVTEPAFGAKELDVQALFYPGRGCTDAVVEALGSARWYIHFQAYNVIPEAVSKALVEARERGVDVEVILDKGQKSDRNSSAELLAKAGVKTFIDSRHASARNSIVIIDEAKVITGSFDFMKSADDTTSDNILVISDISMSAKYLQNWREHQQHAVAYTGKRR